MGWPIGLKGYRFGNNPKSYIVTNKLPYITINGMHVDKMGTVLGNICIRLTYKHLPW